jgi:sugar lactone lactonase YvrE
VLADGGMLVGDAWHRKIYRWGTNGSIEFADLSNTAGCSFSDGIIDGRGGMYISDAGFDFLNPLVDRVPNGVIIYVKADGHSFVVAADLFFPNGMIITPDNGTLIVAETLAHRLIAFEIENDGSLHNRRVWAQFEDDVKPDGICLDCEGAIWVAGTGLRALHVREGGEVDQQITTKRPVFAAMLGGPERSHLLMCTAESNDPVINCRTGSATIDVAEVDVPGSGFP